MNNVISVSVNLSNIAQIIGAQPGLLGSFAACVPRMPILEIFNKSFFIISDIPTAIIKSIFLNFLIFFVISLTFFYSNKYFGLYSLLKCQYILQYFFHF